MADVGLAQRIAAVRRFNRDYTRRIGALQQGLPRTPFSLTEARVMYELANWPQPGERPTATAVGRRLALDAGYLSRILRGFGKRGLVASRPLESDARQSVLAVTAKGRKAWIALNARSQQQVAALLAGLPADGQDRLIGAMQTIDGLLGDKPAKQPTYTLRPHRPGDMGWVVHRHGVLYAKEYGWDERFEVMVAEIVARFVHRFQPEWERCWIAESDGEIVGSVFLVRKSTRVAQLRLLLVEPAARGLGLGTRLVGECERFARDQGYRKIMLWTNSVLHAARHIYEQAGYRLVGEEPHHSFGYQLIGQTWELKL